MRPTVHDIAAEAGVSLATVDRVINGRPGVRRQTRALVEEAIARLGYVRDVAAANLAKSRLYRFVFILPEGPNLFMRALEAELQAARDRGVNERLDLQLVTVPAFDAAALSEALLSIDPDAVSGVALVAVDAPDVRRAVARLAARGVPLVTLVSDLPASARDHFSGIDNIAAGRTAGRLMSRFLAGRSGKVAVLAGSLLVRDHVERRDGFEQVIAACAPALSVLPVIQGRDDDARAGSLVAACLKAHPDLVGIYSLGAGNGGLIDSLEASGRAGSIVVVAHELDARSREALLDGVLDAIIAQDAGHEIRSAIRVLKARADGHAIVAAQERIRIEIFLKDNLP